MLHWQGKSQGGLRDQALERKGAEILENIAGKESKPEPDASEQWKNKG